MYRNFPCSHNFIWKTINLDDNAFRHVTFSHTAFMLETRHSSQNIDEAAKQIISWYMSIATCNKKYAITEVTSVDLFYAHVHLGCTYFT